MSKPLSFRISDTDHARLTQTAASHDVAPTTFARRAVLERLSDEVHLYPLLMRVTALEYELKEVKAQLAIATSGLLVAAGGMTADEASAWVEKRLLSRT